MAEIKVVYIAGATRSGSTLLSNILGEVEGIFNGGELIEFWDRGMVWPCSCGAKVENCRVWQPIVKKVFEGRDKEAVKEITNLRDRYAHTKLVPRLLAAPSTAARTKRVLAPYIHALSDLYRAISHETGCTVIVDASKNTGYGHILKMVPGIDLYIIHLIRDSRAAAYSWLRKKEGLWTSGPGTTSLVWDVRNLVTELLGRDPKKKYFRLLYEDFVRRPEKSISSILNMLNDPNLHPPSISGKSVTFTEGHGLCGNTDRFKRGKVDLRLDQRWIEMRLPLFLFVTILTFPLLLRYRYRLAPMPQAY